MAYRLSKSETVDAGIKRMAGEQINRAIEEIDDEELGPHETVHQVRKRCKKIRALLRLVRPQLGRTYAKENAWYRDAARKLSDIRDTQARIECYDDLVEHFRDQLHRQHFVKVRRGLLLRRDQVGQMDERIAAFRAAMLEGRDRVRRWPLEQGQAKKPQEFDMLAGGLGMTYRRGRRAMCRAYQDRTAESFHEWRKRAKYLWYHVRVLSGVWRPVVQSYRDQVDQLGAYLGDDHNLAVLRQTISTHADEFGGARDVEALAGLVDRRRMELEAKAGPLGDRIFAEKTKRFVERMRAYWQAWRSEPISAATPADKPIAPQPCP